MPKAGEKELYMGMSDGETFGLVQNLKTDDAHAIALRIRTKEYYLGGPDKLDEIQRIFVYSDEPQATNLSISLDNSDYDFLGQIQKVDEPQRFDVWEKCYHFSLGLDEISAVNIKIKGFNVYYEPQIEVR